MAHRSHGQNGESSLSNGLTIVEGHIVLSEDNNQGDKSPFESNQWEETPPDPYPAMDREPMYNQLQTRPTPVQQFTSARSAHFQQMNKVHLKITIDESLL